MTVGFSAASGAIRLRIRSRIALGIKDRHRFADRFQPAARRVAEGRIGQEGNARFVAQTAGDGGGFLGDTARSSALGRSLTVVSARNTV
jgi:hypothetical protein